jgi:hypothetical protein
MGEKECMQRPIFCQGREVKCEEVDFLREWIERNPTASRRWLAFELCRKWEWRDERGRLKDFAARSFLMKLEERNLITLPPVRAQYRLGRREIKPPRQESPAVDSALADLQPIEIAIVEPGSPQAKRWASYLTHDHYLGLRVVGENLGYLARDRLGRDLAVLLFGAPAWRCAARDRHLGWSQTQRAAGLAQLANNTRFLILPQVRVPHLASHLLGAIARRINADWQTKYGHGLHWLETFVESGRFAGTCYRAANWRCVGQTRGRSRQDQQHTLQVPLKAVYLYELRS